MTRHPWTPGLTPAAPETFPLQRSPQYARLVLGPSGREDSSIAGQDVVTLSYPIGEKGLHLVQERTACPLWMDSWRTTRLGPMECVKCQSEDVDVDLEVWS